MRWAGIALATVLAAGLAAPTATIAQTNPDGRYREFGDAGGFLNVMPPGQDGTLNAAQVEQVAAANAADDYSAFPPYFADQQAMSMNPPHFAGSFARLDERRASSRGKGSAGKRRGG